MEHCCCHSFQADCTGLTLLLGVLALSVSLTRLGVTFRHSLSFIIGQWGIASFVQRRVNPKLYPVICPPESDLRNSLPSIFTQIKPVYGAGKVKGKGEMASFSLQSVRDGCHYVVIKLNYCAEEGKGREGKRVYTFADWLCRLIRFACLTDNLHKVSLLSSWPRLQA